MQSQSDQRRERRENDFIFRRTSGFLSRQFTRTSAIFSYLQFYSSWPSPFPSALYGRQMLMSRHHHQRISTLSTFRLLPQSFISGRDRRLLAARYSARHFYRIYRQITLRKCFAGRLMILFHQLGSFSRRAAMPRLFMRNNSRSRRSRSRRSVTPFST